MTQSPRCVCVETPFRGNVPLNVLYADACQLDCLQRGEAPFMGHLQYPRVLNDADPHDRAHGIEAHLAWLRRADAVVIYSDLGITDGMKQAIALAREIGLPFQYRQLAEGWQQRVAAVSGTRDFLARAG